MDIELSVIRQMLNDVVITFHEDNDITHHLIYWSSLEAFL